ncbi:MAG TPA: MBL fold metallo-hydrolase [Solirubrobacteraceae bacterium]|jgi:glyoxylase-like metal-dependent hydrolase (beta-lactamase superfamily II)|nr:MBL fold metallo-hydrolase [Solirubrobacteraceae bacterium]
MVSPTQRRQLGRGERVLPGVWRLRLPLPWPGVPHCNSWAVAAGDGVVLFDTGLHEPGSLAHLERAMSMCHLRMDNVRLVVCTHAHSDHYGQAGTIVQQTGCPLWMHPQHQHVTQTGGDPEAAFARRIEVARSSGVPEAALRRYAAQRREQGLRSGISAVVLPDRELLDGVVVESDLGPWVAYETPGHAPSHVCLYQPDRRVLISGDHLLGRISQYFDYGWSRDPIGEFLHSLDIVEALDARLALSGHGRTFTDVEAHIQANRALLHERLDGARRALPGREMTAFELAPLIFDTSLGPENTAWLLSETLCLLAHLAQRGEVERLGGEPERWRGA